MPDVRPDIPPWGPPPGRPAVLSRAAGGAGRAGAVPAGRAVPAAAPEPGGGRPRAVVVPGFGHPMLAPLEWAELVRPGLPLAWAVLGPSGAGGGPGGRADPFCRTAAARLRVSGRPVLGLLDLEFGARPYRELICAAHRYLQWYRVDGFLLDECPGDPEDLDRIAALVRTLTVLRPGALLVLGHDTGAAGRHPHPGYAEIPGVRQLVTFRGSWAQYRGYQAPEWTRRHPAARFCHLVHGVPERALDHALRVAGREGAGAVYVTDRCGRALPAGRGHTDPWASLPGYWDRFVSCVGTGVSE
ncbi:spherulation-specific family 4 protein [Streptomyces aidingensis]|uniref:Spherulation-specific family 4 n=1 Tax=Streptomyces aidingensis TaxID=910347 RepID=A0A1I1EWR4_9ACTN|nr:spherulation-specific family 4 protein [Streptomyces aidingensis]SFB91417.1 Spherulation-specific family 4 [Streptomyces aidingensis]